jgi:molybdopterin converting factor small subunit
MDTPSDLEAVVQALESQLDSIKHYYDRSTGEVVMIDEEFGEGPEEIEKQGDRFVLIPPLTANERFQIMEDFVEALPNESLQEELNMALIEKGAFLRFEEVLQKYPNRWEQWRRFRGDKVTARAREWFRANSIKL